MTAGEINSVVTALGSILDVLRDADPADKAKIYSGVGLRLTYQTARNVRAHLGDRHQPFVAGRAVTLPAPAVLRHHHGRQRLSRTEPLTSAKIRKPNRSSG